MSECSVCMLSSHCGCWLGANYRPLNILSQSMTLQPGHWPAPSYCCHWTMTAGDKCFSYEPTLALSSFFCQPQQVGSILLAIFHQISTIGRIKELARTATLCPVTQFDQSPFNLDNRLLKAGRERAVHNTVLLYRSCNMEINSEEGCSTWSVNIQCCWVSHL